MDIGRYYSFEILNESEAIKYGDKSFFDHRGTGIPQNTYAFWDVGTLTYPGKKDIKLCFEGIEYDALFRTDSTVGLECFGIPIWLRNIMSILINNTIILR